MPVSFEHRVTVSPDVLFRVIGDEAMLLNLSTEMYLGLDAVATRMWAVLQDAPSIQAGYEALLGEFDVEADVLRQDVEAFLQELLGQSLITLEQGPQQ